MTMIVRFCLSYDPLKLDFIVFKMNIISIRKRVDDRDFFYMAMLHVRAKNVVHLWSYDINDPTLFTD